MLENQQMVLPRQKLGTKQVKITAPPPGGERDFRQLDAVQEAHITCLEGAMLENRQMVLPRQKLGTKHVLE